MGVDAHMDAEETIYAENCEIDVFADMTALCRLALFRNPDFQAEF